MRMTEEGTGAYEDAMLLSPDEGDDDDNSSRDCCCCTWPEDRTAHTQCRLKDRFRAYKNMIGLCISYTLSLGSLLGMVSLESSINAEGGLGLVAVATTYLTSIMTGCVAPAIVKLLGSKQGIILGYSGYLAFILANYYPDWTTLIIASIICGFFLNITIVSIYAHASSVARLYYKSVKETQDNATYLYTSFIALSANCSFIFGNLASSVILFISATDYGSEDKLSNDGVCNNTEAGQLMKDNNTTIYYVLVTVYALFSILNITIVVLLVEQFSIDETKLKCSKSMIKECLVVPVYDIIKTLINWKMLLLIPIFILDGLSTGFLHGPFTKASYNCANII